MTHSSDIVAAIAGVGHRFGGTIALRDLTVDIPAGRMVGLIGPDGVGKSTLLGLVAGAKRIQSGRVAVLGGDMADRLHRTVVCPRIAFMPQGLGKNLYQELSVFENVDFFARLFGQRAAERSTRIARLLEATGLAPFAERPAGKLSGGMKQKVGLCSALVHDPDLLILDEPTTGVDPLSRQQFWTLIDDIRRDRPAMSVIVATASMEEAQRFDWLMAMNDGRILDTGSPSELRARTSTRSLEETFVALLPPDQRGRGMPLVIPPRPPAGDVPAIVATHLTRRFGSFTAVNDVSFSIDRGEIFGFLGSNGCGKSTTMKVLTGLLPASAGEAFLFGERVDASNLDTRRRVGYMSQAFSLSTELTVRQNLWLHARLFHIPTAEARARIDDLVLRFGLGEHLDDLAEVLPIGVRQRLSLAVAVIHAPEMLILDEPTSGVDPIARDEFWELLIDLSRRQNVTIFISTHFMTEAMRCDRISLMHAGRVLACDTPAALMAARSTDDLDHAFIGYIADAELVPGETPAAAAAAFAGISAGAAPATAPPPPLSRLLAYSHRETLEILRDPVRLAFAFGGSILLMLVFGFGITTDVENVRYAELDQDRSPSSRDFLAAFAGSRAFERQPALTDVGDLHRRLRSNDIAAALDVPVLFGRELAKGSAAEVSALVDGANPFRAETIAQYLRGATTSFMQDQARRDTRAPALVAHVAPIEPRFLYNPSFESVYAIVPSIPPLLLVLLPAILTAVSVVREKELGSITNFYVTPTTRFEFLVGKQLPSVVIAMINFMILMLMATVVFEVPIKGSGPMLTLCALLYVTATTAIGLVVAAFTSSQVAAVFVTAILTMLPTTQFSGLLQPVSTLEGSGRIIGTLWPTTYFMHASVGAFTKGLGAELLLPDALALAAFIPVLIIAAMVGLEGQED